MEKKVALIGATGFVGSHILDELLNRQYQVTAIARDVEKIKNRENLIAVQVDVSDESRLASAMKGNNAVISAFNAGWSNPNIYDDYINGSRNILLALKDAGIKRIITIGGAGSLIMPDGNRLIDSPDFPKAIKPGAQAATDFLEIISRENELDWTFFSPAIEMNVKNEGTRTGKYRTGTDHPIFDHNGHSNISVQDLAVAIVDELENGQFIKKRFTAAY